MSFRNDFTGYSKKRVEKGVHCVESYTVPYATLKDLRWRTLPAVKEATYYTGVNNRAIVELDPSLDPAHMI
jgi:hypothetical protein